MHRALLLAAATVVGLGIGIAELTACGDMVLRPGHSQRVRGYAPLYPAASILLYVPEGVRPNDVKASHEFQTMLTKRGGHPTLVVHGIDALRNALAASRPDMIITRLNDAATVRAAAADAPARPDVVPFASKTTSKAMLQQTEREYRHMLVEGLFIEEILERLDHVMEPRRRGTQPALSR